MSAAPLHVEHSGFVNTVGICWAVHTSPRSSFLLGSVRLPGECIMTLDGHEDWVRTANFSPDGITLRPNALKPMLHSYSGTGLLHTSTTCICYVECQHECSCMKEEAVIFVRHAHRLCLLRWDSQASESDKIPVRCCVVKQICLPTAATDDVAFV